MAAPKLFMEVARKASHVDAWRAFEAFCKLAACALSMEQREAEYMEEVVRWKPDVVEGFCHVLGQLVLDMEARPFYDVLGDLSMELRSPSSKTWGGEFYTPQPVCDLMASMVLGNPADAPAGRPINVLEPAVGSGRMVLSLAKAMLAEGVSPLCMRVTCFDVSKCACDMAYINLTLSCVPCMIVHGNTLSGEVWGSWRNPLWWLARPATRETKAASALPPPEPQEALRGQFAFDFDLGAKQ